MSEAVDVKTLVIDEKEVSARRGHTILQVARENDIDIPWCSCRKQFIVGVPRPS